jgi:cation diffusion facilitator CzcD-associated flavoprotein CzcO
MQERQQMNTTNATQSSTNAAQVREYDAIVIGAGVSGLYQLYKLRELGLKALVLESGTNIAPIRAPPSR